MVMAASNRANVTTNPLLTIGERVEKMRRSKGMSQIQLAAALHIPHTALSAIENGREPPGPATQDRLVEVLGPRVMTPDVLQALQDVKGLEKRSLGITAHGGPPQPYDFGARLRQFRLKAGYSPEYVADYLEVTVKAIYRWEDGRGQPNWGTVEKLEALFGLDFIAPEMWRNLAHDLPSKPPEKFGPRLRYFRLMYGWSARSFGNWIGSSETSVRHWEAEHGLPRRETFDRIVDVVGPEFVTTEIAMLFEARVSISGSNSKRGRPLPPLPSQVPTEPGPRIKYYRIAAGLTLDGFAKALEVSRTTAHTWESGKPPMPEYHAWLTQVLGPDWRVESDEVTTPRSRTPS